MPKKSTTVLTHEDVIRNYLIGNPSIYIKVHNDKTKGWVWSTKYEQVTVGIIKEHVKGNISIGSMPIYRKWHSLYCRWIALDIDFHADNKQKKAYGVNETLKKMALQKIDELFIKSEKYFNITNESMFVEDSGGGYHVWIILNELTTLNNANIYIDYIRPRIQELFIGIDDNIEFFPKQRTENMKVNGKFDLFKRPGTGLKLPFGINFKRDRPSEIILGNPFAIIPAKITEFCKKIKFKVARLRASKLSTTVTTNKIEDKYLVRDVDLKFFYTHPNFRPCFKNIIDGSFQCRGSNGNLMRVGLSNELYYFNAPKEVIIKAFENQTNDYDPVKTAYHVEKCIQGVKAKGNPLRFQCSSISDMGYCIEDCWKKGNTTRLFDSTKDHEIQSVNGWKGLHKMNDQIVNETGKRYYYYKTTRSGTTTSVIIKALQHKKKILMIAPLVNIFKITVQNAIELGKKDGFLGKYDKYFTHRVRSNFEVCSLIEKKFGTIEGIQNIFPFFFKGYCKKCHTKTKDACVYNQFLENLENFDLIYLTVKKFNAMIGGGENSQKLLRRLLKWSDIIFVDECSHIFDAEWDSFVLWTQKDTETIDKTNDWYKVIDDFVIAYPDWNGSEQITLMIEFIDFITNELNDIKVLNKAHFKALNNAFHDKLNMKQKVAFYQKLIDFYKKTEVYEIKTLVECFLAMNRKTIYLQLILPLREPKKVILAAVNDIDTMVKYLNDYTSDKLLLFTDATKPPIDLEKCIDDLDYVYINDPMKTAQKQSIYVYPHADSFNKLSNTLKNEIIMVMDKYAKNTQNPVFLLTQSKKVMRFILAITREYNTKDIKKIWTINHMDYFRGKSTKGQPSPLRKMIVLGSPRPPSHCYDYVAAIYRKAGFLTRFKSAGEAGKYLEIYSAQSAFFQGISRSKCPKGEVDSIVIVYGIKIEEIKEWLENMKIATPKIYLLD